MPVSQEKKIVSKIKELNLSKKPRHQHMNNETFGTTFQYAICQEFNLEHQIETTRIDDKLLGDILDSGVIHEIFKNKKKPVAFLSRSKRFTSDHIKRCPHNFLLEGDETFSIKTFSGSQKMFAPKVVGQAGDITFNHFFGHLHTAPITRENFKEFCFENIESILQIAVDYALVSDNNCWLYRDGETFSYKIIKREDLPDVTFEKKHFTFTKATAEKWNESNTVKYKGKTVMELQLHNNRPGYKIRLHRENFPELLKVEKTINNSLLGDTAELAICEIFNLDPGLNNDRLTSNSDRTILNSLIDHYTKHKGALFPLNPTKYSGTETRERGGSSKSGVDFHLEQEKTLSLKTNKTKSYKVCPPEIGQPSPKTFDLHFASKGWYQGKMNEEKFRTLVRDTSKVALLLKEYTMYLNECEYLLWTLYLDRDNISSKLINKTDLENICFTPELISYSNDFTEKSSVTIRYGNNEKVSLGEFQIHSARNSLKFRFNFNNLLSLSQSSQ